MKWRSLPESTLYLLESPAQAVLASAPGQFWRPGHSCGCFLTVLVTQTHRGSLILRGHHAMMALSGGCRLDLGATAAVHSNHLGAKARSESVALVRDSSAFPSGA